MHNPPEDCEERRELPADGGAGERDAEGDEKDEGSMGLLKTPFHIRELAVDRRNSVGNARQGENDGG